MKHSILGLSALLLVVGCDRGTWVDVPLLCGMVKQLETEGKTTNAEAKAKETVDGWTKLEGQGACGKAGKSYSGTYDCDDGKSRVRCE